MADPDRSIDAERRDRVGGASNPDALFADLLGLSQQAAVSRDEQIAADQFVRCELPAVTLVVVIAARTRGGVSEQDLVEACCPARDLLTLRGTHLDAAEDGESLKLAVCLCAISVPRHFVVCLSGDTDERAVPERDV